MPDATLDGIWIAAAARVGLPVRRGGDAYVHFDGEALHVAGDVHLDDDDTLAQLVLHELCHALVEGPAARHAADWGLDNTSERDAVREAAAVRLQAHLLGAHGLRGVLYPTTVVRDFYEALPPHDALGPADDESARLARAAALRAAREPWASALDGALTETAERVNVPRHRKSGHPLATSGARCGGCAFRSAGGLSRKGSGGRRVFVSADEPACARFEEAVDCRTCGACCRSAYDAVEVSRRDPVNRRHPELVVARGSRLEVLRAGDRCAALAGPGGGPFACNIYDDRPRTCRDFERGGRHCLDARRRVGLSL